MSEADKLFEELGYEKWIDSRNIIHFIHKKKEKDFTFMNGNCYSIKRPTQKEQVAINKKVEELRMDMSNKTSDKNVANIEDDVKILEEFAEICKAGLACSDQTREGEALERILAELGQKDKRIQELGEQVKMLDEAYTGTIKEGKKWFDIAHNSIPKQVVVDKICEYNEKIEKYTAYREQGEETDVEYYENIANTIIIQVLQELLEGEK